MSGGLLIVAGIWVITQVFGGHALDRLGLTKPQQESDSGGSATPTPGSSGSSGIPGGSAGGGSGGAGGGSW